MARARAPPSPGGLVGLRGASALSELLFLDDIATTPSTRLRPIAERLGVTVQGASHTYRQLARRGLAERRDGRYVPSVRGVEWLHATLRTLADDLFARQQRLPIVRSLRAIAERDLAPGDPVGLALVDGRLVARRGRSTGSRGRVALGGSAGALVTVEGLEGILELDPAPVRVVTFPVSGLSDPRVRRRITALLPGVAPGWIGASGLEATHLLETARAGPFVRFAVAAAAAESARLGVPSTVFVLDEGLPGLLVELARAGMPRVAVVPLDGPRRPPRRARARTLGERPR